MSTQQPLLLARSLSRSYGSVQAVVHADIDLFPGEVHGLVGENGAGKSTLVRLLTGVEVPDGGELIFHHPAERPLRVAMVPQYPRMAQSLSVRQNLLVGDEPRWGPFLAPQRGRREIEAIADRYDIALDIDKPASELGGTEVRLAALLAALVHHPDVLILDEPTVGLAGTDQEAILNTLRRFRDGSHAILYISHDLREVCDIADRVTPLQEGRTKEVWVAPVSAEALAGYLFGHGTEPRQEGCEPVEGLPRGNGPQAVADVAPGDAVGEATPPPEAAPPTHAALRLDAAVVRNYRSGRHLGPLDLVVEEGLITAITGIRESGLDLIEQYLAGEAVLDAGAIRLAGRRLNSRVDPARLRRRDVAFIPSDRFDRAAALSGSVEENAILQERAAVHPGGFRTNQKARGTTHRLLDMFGLRLRRSQQLSALSGGTIQKLILARELDRAPHVCVIAEPTAGLDLQSQEALAALLRRLADGGTAVVILSSNVQSVQRMADRVHVLHDGLLVGTYGPQEEQSIARAFAGIAGGCP